MKETSLPEDQERPVQVDLSQLAVDRSAPTVTPYRRRRVWLTRYGIPLSILIAFAGLFGWAARESFLPSHPVTVMPVLVTRTEGQQAGTPLFQAAGWIEPRPTLTVVSSLASGVIGQLHVVEGESVSVGDEIATLIDTDAQLELRQAEADLQLRQAEVIEATAMLTAAKIRLDKPTRSQVALADAQAQWAQISQELAQLPFALQAAQTHRMLAQYTLVRKKRAGDAVSGQVLRAAEAELAVANNTIAELQAREPTLKIQQEALQKKCSARQQELELMTEERRNLAAAKAGLMAAQARVAKVQVVVETARLQLDRMVVKAPMSGCILRLLASPGKRLTGLDPHSPQGSSAVVSMYDPSLLQVRVDVRLEDVPLVQPGQEVQIQTAALSGSITGKVISVTTWADIQKNTLQVKVAIESPPEVIKPEMLAQAIFLAPMVVESDKQLASIDNEPLRILIPRSLVNEGENGNYVWLANLETRFAQRQPVQLGQAGTEALVEVTQGISPMDKLIVAGREGLQESVRIRITGEDKTLGTGERIARKPRAN